MKQRLHALALCLLPWLLPCVLAGLLVLHTAATDQDRAIPSRAIRIVAPFGAGGGDTSLRMLSSHLAKAQGQPMAVDNKPGANGNIGAQVALCSAPDGCALFYGNTTPLAAEISSGPSGGVFTPLPLSASTSDSAPTR